MVKADFELLSSLDATTWLQLLQDGRYRCPIRGRHAILHTR